MEIILIKDAMLRESLLFALDLCCLTLAITTTGALLAKSRAMMYWFVMMVALNVLAVIAIMAFLTGNAFLLLVSFSLVFVMLISYVKQKKIITAETTKQLEIERRQKAKADADAKAEMKNFKETNHSDYMPK